VARASGLVGFDPWLSKAQQTEHSNGVFMQRRVASEEREAGLMSRVAGLARIQPFGLSRRAEFLPVQLPCRLRAEI
jgi:hypothetical protein